MKTMFHRLCLALLFAGAAVFSVQAQAARKTDAYTPGETLVYELKLNRKLLPALAVGDLNFTVSGSPDNRDYIVKAEAASKGTILKLLKQRYFQRIESTVDGARLSVLRTLKRDEQGRRVRESEAVFDYGARKVTYFETDPNDRARPPRTIASSIPAGTQDLVSGIYMLRHLPLAVGKTFEVPVSDSGVVYRVPVRVTARELQNSIFGKIWCFRVEPEVFGANRMIENEGKLMIWITDDSRRMPVRAQIDTGFGRVEARLKRTNVGIPDKND